ncbi:hypothetical protein C2W59_03534 [Bacillus pumilus]|uniref:Uncharacterized protein n=1 Tax=Bacillus pumilus TaxID=1408 RepID=A0AB34QYU0_BACPU|nr:hypothetical protein [Bacillus pumilus]KIL25175.1 hypothetical protein B4127_0159 [Bacillus pumilus]RAP10960.1 hypothetical protein C2W58_03865 [Bacillus pumilus]RAP22537.1 hypothetical protein C2W59_03534 [Bacillus pumilus]
MEVIEFSADASRLIKKEITAVSVSLKQRGDSLYKGNTHDLPN